MATPHGSFKRRSMLTTLAGAIRTSEELDDSQPTRHYAMQDEYSGTQLSLEKNPASRGRTTSGPYQLKE
jgi:hypothetical protein